MNDLVYAIWLNNIENVMPAKKILLLEHFGGFAGVYDASRRELTECEILAGDGISALLKKSLGAAQKELKRCAEMGISLIAYGAPEYPGELHHIYDPPVLLYAKGDLSLLQNKLAFCIVGTRESTEYGNSAAMAIASQLAECSVTIVSGCALGIDSAAHMGALRVRGKTIGVTAGGINLDYPAGNKSLRGEIEKRGLLISEFPLDAPPLKMNFPRRNRILSGLSLGVAVIEAGYRSGALITADHAREQNKDVFALPGNINSMKSDGANELIADGATLIFGADTILGEYIVRYPELFDLGSVILTEETAVSDASKSAAALGAQEKSGSEKEILKVLKDGERYIDYIAQRLEMPASQINSLLTLMQIKGMVYEKPGRLYGIR